jgi:hypothetical protein
VISSGALFSAWWSKELVQRAKRVSAYSLL